MKKMLRVSHLSAKHIRRKEMLSVFANYGIDKAKLAEVRSRYADCTDLILSKTERISRYATGINNNVCVIGSAGSRKTSGYILTNILQCCTPNPYTPSLVINDGHGEILSQTGKALEEAGYIIKVLNLCNPSKSLHFNPFQYFQDEDEICMLSAAIVNHISNDRTFEFAKIALLNVLIGLCVDEVDECSLYSVFEKCQMIRENAMAYSMDLWEEIMAILHEKEWNRLRAFVLENWDVLLNFISKEKGLNFNILFREIELELEFFSILEIKTLLSEDEFSLEKIVQEKTAVFVVYPRVQDNLNVIANLFYTSLIEVLRGIDLSEQLNYPIRFLLDDFCKVGRVANLDSLMLLGDTFKYNVDVSLTMQNVMQMQVLYGIYTGKIVSHCDTVLCFRIAACSNETAEFVSMNCGGVYSYCGFIPRISIREIKKIKRDEVLVCIRSIDICKSKPFYYEKHKNYKLTASYNPERKYLYETSSRKKED